MRETFEPTDSQSGPPPEEPAALASLEVATYFRAGGQGAVVGGDWYDALALPDGRTALVVGDVMGRGVRAAAVMTQVRDVVRAYVRMGVPPLELIGSLDHLVVARFPEQLVTCLYAVFDHAELSLEFVNAGHVPPLLTHPDGSCTSRPVRAWCSTPTAWSNAGAWTSRRGSTRFAERSQGSTYRCERFPRRWCRSCYPRGRRTTWRCWWSGSATSAGIRTRGAVVRRC
jgi:Stage II sporulation protein E (SpoIIE)